VFTQDGAHALVVSKGRTSSTVTVFVFE
jgi:hypothetical protein